MSLDKYINLLTEEIVGNLATVYHRGDENKLNHLLNKTYRNRSHIDFGYYNKALYTTTDMASQLNQVGNKNNMKKLYGDYIIKLVFKGISNCWFCDYDEYKKFNNCTIDNWKEQQLKKFNIIEEDQKKTLGFFNSDKEHTSNHVLVSRFFEARGIIGKIIKGIQYKGKYDGNCLLIYDWSTAVPVAVSSDEGKTWEKVDKTKTSFSRNNFNKNDYIDNHKKLKEIKFNFKNEKDNIDCSKQGITTLFGAPKKVNGYFDCEYNNLTSLKFAPEEVEDGFCCANNALQTLQYIPKVGQWIDCSCNILTSLSGVQDYINSDFYCYNNKLTSLKGGPKAVRKKFSCDKNELTSLQGAPEYIGGDFECRDNKLSKEEILRYLKSDTTLEVLKKLSKEKIIIKGKIKTDYGNFDSQEEAIKKLSGLNEEIFNY